MLFLLLWQKNTVKQLRSNWIELLEWPDLYQHYLKKYDFLARVKLQEEGKEEVQPHPVIVCSTGLALDCIFNEKSNKNVVIQFPQKININSWVTALVSLQLLKMDYNKYSPNQNFLKGQKLLFNNKCIVEFSRFGLNNLWFRVADNQYASNNYISLPYGRILDLQTTTSTKPLSSINQVLKEYKKAEKYAIDNILQIHTSGNLQFFHSSVLSVDKIGQTRNFLTENYFNSQTIIDLFLWGKLDSEGNCSDFQDKYDADPSCIISPNIISTEYFLTHPHDDLKAIFVNDISFIQSEITTFDNILDYPIPIVIFSDLSNSYFLPKLYDRGFIVWDWNEKSLNELLMNFTINETDSTCSIDRMIRNFSEREIEIVECEHQVIEKTIEKLIELEKELPEDQGLIRNLYSRLFALTNDLSRTAIIPELNQLSNLISRLSRIKVEMNNQRLWLNEVSKELLDGIFKDIEILLQTFSSIENDKPAQMLNYLYEKIGTDKVVVTSDGHSSSEIKNYYKNKISASSLINTSFTFPSEYLGTFNNQFIDEVLIVGWLGRSTMFSIVHFFNVKKIVFFLYPFEKKWYESATKYWDQYKVVQMISKDWSDHLDIQSKELEFIDHEKKITIKEVEAGHDIFELKIKLLEHFISRFQTTDGTEDAVDAKLITFTNDKIAFVTLTYKLIYLTDLINDRTEIIEKKDINHLNSGDVVLFFNSDRDTIRDYADYLLKENNIGYLRELAHSWKNVLINIKDELGFEILLEELKKAGCNRHKVTINNWIKDEDLIGPRSDNDLRKVLNLDKDSDLPNKYDKIVNAIHNVRRVHHKASSLLSSRLIKILPQLIHDNIISHNAMIDIEGFGEAEIVTIQEIQNQKVKINKYRVNKIMGAFEWLE